MIRILQVVDVTVKQMVAYLWGSVFLSTKQRRLLLSTNHAHVTFEAEYPKRIALGLQIIHYVVTAMNIYGLPIFEYNVRF